MTLDRLRATLEALGPPVTPLELAEMLWLARTLPEACESPEGADGPRPRPGGPRLPPDAHAAGGTGERAPVPGPEHPEEQAAAEGDRAAEAAEPGGRPLHLPRGAARPGTDADDVLVPAPQALRHELAIQRSLRPLKRRVPDPRRRVLDEDATAARAAERATAARAAGQAERRPWVPVLVPAACRPLRLALVVDTGSAMAVWRPLAGELRAALQRTGAFHDVRLWYVADLGTRVGLRPSPGRPAVPPAAAADPTGRQLTLVLSDCSGPHWWAGRAGQALHTWARRGPTAVLQPLPERLWRRTAAPTVPGRATAARAHAPNSALRFTPHHGRAHRPAGALPVPVLELAPEWLADWAALVAAAGDRPRDTAVTYVGAAPPALAEPLAEEGDLPIAERVLRFQLAASRTAADLAAHVALSVPALPVMRLIQQRVTPGSRPSDLAEVLLSGLLEPVDPERGLYDFAPGARAALIETLPRPESLAVTDLLTRLGEEIESRMGSTARSFRAVVPVAGGGGTRQLGAAGQPFALVSEEALEVLRGVAIRVAPRPAAGPGPGGDAVSSMVGEPSVTALPAPHEVSAPPGLTNVPRPATFVGRAAELQRLDERLLAPRPQPEGPHAVVVRGSAGAGKSALVAQWAAGDAVRASLNPVWRLRASSLTEGLAELARALQPEVSGAVTREPMSEYAAAWLAAHRDWLLILDDADNPADIAALLERLGTGGRVLVTSRRAHGWEAVGPVLELGTMEPTEAVELLRVRLDQDLAEGDAHSLAEAVGRLPLALSTAAVHMAAEGMSPAQYLMFLERGRTLADRDRPVAADAIRTTLRRVDDPTAHRVLNVLAHLAPKPVPLGLLSGIDTAVALETLEESGLVSTDGDTLRIHPLVHEFLNEPDEGDPWRGPAALRAARSDATACLGGALPEDAEDPVTWPRWQALLPHVDHVAERVAPEDDDADFVHVLEATAEFVIGQGQAERAVALLERAEAGRERGPGFGSPESLRTTRLLVNALRRAGRLREAVQRCETARWLPVPNDPEALQDILLLRVELASLKRQSGDMGAADEQFATLRESAFRALGRQASPQLVLPCAAIADLALALGRSHTAVELYEATLAAARGELGEDHPDTLVVRGRLAAALYATGERGRASREGTQVLVDLTRVFGADHPRVISALGDVAHALEGGEETLPDAVNAYREALRRSRAARGGAHPETQRLWSHLVDVEVRAGNPQSAVEAAKEWRSVVDEALGPRHPATLRASAWLARAYGANRAWSLAIPLYERTLDLQREVLGEDSPETWESYDRLAELFAEMGDVARALPVYERALLVRRESLGDEHEETLAALDRTAVALLGAGRHDRAVALLDQVLALRRRVLGDGHADVLRTYSYLGYAHLEARDPARAVVTYRTALHGCVELFGDADPRTVAMTRNLVDAQLSGGDHLGAVEVLERAVAALAPALGADHRDVLALKDELARLRPRGRGGADGP
ncbi:SAV_2336 N-terminal domain-related protein [Streptomyces sp. AN091965]|uniref:SAV_2336 N-terminal domain-related protein n=1 Tax=Streptomyces sp. AN091965 TaxID=2927803 RepID=UPI001F604925|nr:SAV_2336 N-terminal domain-related protein [Streptomyces sp. AN091965]MCI3934009.1 tetratricopeptide repeat protein [Streptomyces sp. AN091965]